MNESTPPAQSAQQGARHPEDFCHRCGGLNIVWNCDSEIWNEFAKEHGIICPLCLAELAKAKFQSWKLIPDPVLYESVAPPQARGTDTPEIEKRLQQVCEEWANDDTQIRALCEKHGIDTAGDSFAVPTMVECVEALETLLSASRAREEELRKALSPTRDAMLRLLSYFRDPKYGAAFAGKQYDGANVKEHIKQATDALDLIAKALRHASTSPAEGGES